ncbi:MAG TPA: helix-turn-helix domain-containing protein [Candidatus Nanoarchaeia archaeon]|nr:helix-turn-helix domain-containing protein [Candidatus Nanoarchaeia archaeon]
MLKQDLQGIGLTDGETKAYLAMLELGSSTVGPIAKKSGISYSKIYEVLERLIDKGIVSFIIKEKTRYFQAIEPNMLYRFLEMQESEIEKNKEKLKKIIPELEKHTKIFENKEEVELFVGLKGLRTASEKMYSNFAKKDIALFLYVNKEGYSDIVDEFYLKLAPFYKQKGIKFKGIGNKTWAKSEYSKKTKSFIDARYVDFPLPGTIDIYKDMVLQVSWSNKPIGILIQSKEIAENYRNYFNEVWKVAKK